MPSPTHDLDAETRRGNLKAAAVVIAVILFLSVLLGGMLFRNYSIFLSYSHHTLTSPATPPPWIAEGPLSPEGCVDATLDWARECVGIKSLCDEYTTRVAQECLEQGDHDVYCEALGARTATTEFGLQECYARGTKRNQDSESCSSAYRAIDSYCAYLRDKAAVERGEEPIGRPTSRPQRPRHD